MATRILITAARVCSCVLALVLVFAPAWAGGGAFLAGVEDLPLMPGMSESAAAGTTFDTPAGRIVEAYAEGTATGAQVLRFYQETLPQLGWTAKGSNTFHREGERLKLEIVTERPRLSVRFTVVPE
ncbi:MAG: hypothetical protein HQL37_14140 [Alphaproteobacteria bacterium]|nr:hypothetical protein [Alphaproteobacteria bacterium]